MLRNRQHGLGRGTTLILVLVVGSAVYLGVAFWQPVICRYNVRERARELARSLVTTPENESYRVQALITDVFDRERIALDYNDVVVERLDSAVRVRVWLDLPYKLPFTKHKRTWKTLVEASVPKAKGL